MLLTEGERWGLTKKSIGNIRGGRVIPEVEKVATDLYAPCQVRPI